MIKKGSLIVFEGGEGSGKSTQAKLLYSNLKKRGVPVIFTEEPGGTLIGTKIRKLLKRDGNSILPLSELMLFNASRSQLFGEVITPALKEKLTVICDRYIYSTVAYQGYGRGLNFENIDTINRIASGGIKPDLVILLDIDPAIGLKRKSKGSNDRFELESIDFHARVRHGYLNQYENKVEPWIKIDATKPKFEIHQLVLARLELLLEGPNHR